MKRQVALLIETSSQYGRDLLGGIIRYMRMHDQWLVYADQSDLPDQHPKWLETWSGDGIISRAITPSLQKAVGHMQIPLVNLTDRYGQPHLPAIRSDDVAIGEMAFDHLRQRHFKTFGFCGFRNEAWSERRQTAFIEAARRHTDAEVEVFNSDWHDDASYEQQRGAIGDWLQQIESPVGIMACNDVRGRQVIDACLHIGRAVPQEVAVIGVDNDEFLCRLCSPPLSSVIPDASRIGFAAAGILDNMMHDRPVERSLQTVAPLSVVTRQSTDVVAIDDTAIASALDIIRQNACLQISVDDVARRSNVSRSTLERQFRKLLGRTPQEEIRYVQIQRVKELLTTTNLPITEIADCCGFDHPEYLHAVFKRFTSVTPGRFRKEASDGKRTATGPKASVANPRA